jgi:hypothetical protein
MNVIAEITDNHNAVVIVTDDEGSGHDFHIHSGSVYTYAALADETNAITRHYFGFTAELSLAAGPNGSRLVGGTDR